MLQRIPVLIFLFLLFFLVVPNSYAKDNNGSTDSAVPKSIDVFALFWPITVGKTADDPLYFLKDLKEKIRGVLIFGQSQKAEYEALLATKRILEAEKLYSENKQDFGDKTLKIAQENLGNIEEIFTSKPDLSSNSGEIFRKLHNLEKYLLFIIVKENQEQFKPTLSKIQLLINELRSQTSSTNN